MKKQLMVGLILIALIACVGVVSATRSGPTFFEWHGQFTCTDIPGLPQGTVEFKIDEDPVANQWYTNTDGFKVMVDSDPSTAITWIANNPVNAVIIKDGGGDIGNYYTYVPPQASDMVGDLTVPSPYGQVSHIIFCYIPDDDQQVPEFPALALPVGMIIGFLGIVVYIRGTKEN